MSSSTFHEEDTHFQECILAQGWTCSKSWKAYPKAMRCAVQWLLPCRRTASSCTFCNALCPVVTPPLNRSFTQITNHFPVVWPADMHTHSALQTPAFFFESHRHHPTNPLVFPVACAQRQKQETSKPFFRLRFFLAVFISFAVAFARARALCACCLPSNPFQQPLQWAHRVKNTAGLNRSV